MAKVYELVALNVTIGGKVFYREDNPKFSEDKFNPKTLDSLYSQGFMKPKGTKANTPQAVIDQYVAEQEAIAKDANKAAAKKAEEEAKAAEKAAEEAKKAEEEAAAKKAEEEAKAAEKAKVAKENKQGN